MGEDAAVIDFGNTLSGRQDRPHHLRRDEIGWYAVNVNANDIAVMGATPLVSGDDLVAGEDRMATLAEAIYTQIGHACDGWASLAGGHTEITTGWSVPYSGRSHAGRGRF